MSFIDRFHKKVAGNMVCGVICSASLKVAKVLDLLSSRHNRVWCAMPNDFSAQNIFSLLEDRNNVELATTKSKHSESPGITICSSGLLRDKLLQDFRDDSLDHIEFADVIVIDGLSSGMLDSVTVLALWNRVYQSDRGFRVPRLVLLLDSMEVPENIPLDMPYIHDEDLEPKVVYAGEADMVVTIKSRARKDNLTNDYVVYCEDEETSMKVTRQLARVPKSKVYQLNKNSPRSKFIDSNAPNVQQRKIIVTSEPIVHHEQCIVFDQLKCKIKGESRFVSKTLAHQRATHSIECVRMCTNDMFDVKVTVHNTPQYRTASLLGLLAQLFETKVDPVELFAGFIDEELITKGITELKKQRMINNSNTILKAGNLFLRLPLSHRPTALIHHAIERSLPLFPFIVLAVFVEMGETEFFTERPEVSEQTPLLTTHLIFWTKYAEEIKTLKPPKKILTEWCKTNLLDTDAVAMLCKTIITCFNTLEMMYEKNFIIGKFSTPNLINTATPMIHEIYKDDIYVLSADDRYYVDSSDRRFLIPDRVTSPPMRVIALTKTHNKITSYLPDENMYSKHSVLNIKSSLERFIDDTGLSSTTVEMIDTVFHNNITERMAEGDEPDRAVDAAIQAVKRMMYGQFDDTEAERITNLVMDARDDLIRHFRGQDEDDDELPALIPEIEEE